MKPYFSFRVSSSHRFIFDNAAAIGSGPMLSVPAKGRSIAAMKKNTRPSEPERTATAARLNVVGGKTYVSAMVRNVPTATTVHSVTGTWASLA